MVNKTVLREDLEQAMYGPGGSIRLIVKHHDEERNVRQCVAASGSAAQVVAPSTCPPEEAKDSEASEFYFPAALLRTSSPVFASMLDGPWKESGEAAVTVNNFQPDAFRAFLNCLLHLANDTARSGDELIFTPSVIRKVLPIAHYFQVAVLKQHIVCTVMEMLRKQANDTVIMPLFITAANSLLAVEASLPESEIPDWTVQTLQQVFKLMVGVNVELSHSEWRPRSLTEDCTATAHITYKSWNSRSAFDNGINDLSKKTLKNVLQSISLEVKQTLPGLQTSKGNVQSTNWPAKITFELV
jgi:hypothetical protein